MLGWLPVPCLSDDPKPPTVIHSTNRCLWYDQCAPSQYGANNYFNCFYNGPPKNITEGTEFYNLLKATCPNLVKEGRGVCCNIKQLNTLATQIKYPQQLFSRCPACLRNFIDHFCLTTCDPDQAAWTVPTQMTLFDKERNLWSIENVSFYVSTEYVDGLYDSCENVQYPQASTKVVDIMCGTTECNGERFLTYLGDPIANHESPFPMVYVYHNNGSVKELVSKTYDFKECNTTDPNYQCSCSDCDAANVCPPPPHAPPNTFPYFELTVSIISVGVGLSFFIFAVAMVAAVISMRRMSGYTRIDTSSGGSGRPQRGKYGGIDDDNDSPTSSVGSINADDENFPKDEDVDPPPPSVNIVTYWFQLGSWIEYAIKWAFYHWGKFVAQFWYIVFFFAGIIVIALAFGLFFFHVTTDTVELWSSPTSRARQEKAYFDEHFNPFYRTEMIIVTAPSSKVSYYQPSGDASGKANWTFGPVFDKNVLEEV